MFDLTDVRPAGSEGYSRPRPAKVKTTTQQAPVKETQEDKMKSLSEGFQRVEKNDPNVRFQKILESNREAEGRGLGFDPTDFSGLGGKMSSEKAQEIYEQDVKAGLVEEDPENDEFIS